MVLRWLVAYRGDAARPVWRSAQPGRAGVSATVPTFLSERLINRGLAGENPGRRGVSLG